MAAGTWPRAGAGESGGPGRGQPAPCREGGGGAGRGRLHRHRAIPGRDRPAGAAPALGALPMTDTPLIAAITVLGLLLGLLLMLAGRRLRRRRGLGEGRTVSLDRVTLTSRRLGLTGRPDRLIRQDGV